MPSTFSFALMGGAALSALAVGVTLYAFGKSVGENEMRVKAAKEAVERIGEMEKNNANFRKLSDRDRCLVFMRDSGLPDSACD